MIPTAWRIAGLLTLLGAVPALALDERYEGRRELVGGSPACSNVPTEVSMEVGADGGVRGEVFTTDGPLRFYGTLSATGRLLGTYRVSTGSDYTSVEGVLSEGSVEGSTQSKSCRYRLHLTRR